MAGGFLPEFIIDTQDTISKRVILHADLNNFFASVEIMRHPELSPYPVAVCGSQEERHGIVLAKNQLAKKFDIQTGEPVVSALAKCPELKIAEPHYDDYMEISHRVRSIYEQVTDRVEAFGIDECWLDVTGSRLLFGGGYDIAERLRKEIKEKLKLTISVGVSFNKVFAKLGSDMKKPDAVTVIERDTFREQIWGLPASDMLGVGRASAKTLRERSVHTIGDIARTSPELMRSYFGKNGYRIWACANGYDASPVSRSDFVPEIKSVSHGSTTPKDVETEEEAEHTLLALSTEVGKRLRAAHLSACGISVAVRDKNLFYREFSCRLPRPTQSSIVLGEEAFRLFSKSYSLKTPVRSLTVRAISLIPANAPRQLDIFEPAGEEEKTLCLYEAIDDIKSRFGDMSIMPAAAMSSKNMLEKHPPKTLPGVALMS